jgi:hypothetical protein
MNLNYTRWITLLAVAVMMMTTSPASADDAGTSESDVGASYSDTGGTSPTEDHWTGTLPAGAYQAISTDAVLPLPLTIIGWSQSEATALSFIDMTVRPKDSDAPVAGTLSYHKVLGLVLWQPAEPLAPLTTYSVSVLVDNEGLSALGAQTWPNITSDFEVTTGADALALGALPVLDEPTVTYEVTPDVANCPYQQAICDANGDCVLGVPYDRIQVNIALTWRDGEADGQELFFTHRITEGQGNSWVADNTGADTLQNAHTLTLTPALTFGDQHCFEVEAIDLRAVAAGDPSLGSRKVPICASLADKPADPDRNALLAACVPHTTPDNTANNTSSDDGGCSTTHTRSLTHNPAGLLLGLAVAFGAALSLRRRQKTLATR